MSITEAMSIHQVAVIPMTVMPGTALSKQRTWNVNAPSKTLACRVVPAVGNIRMTLGIRMPETTHVVRFPKDPQIDETVRLQWLGPGNGVVMRLTAPVYNPHGIGWLWHVECESKREDNQGGGPLQ